LNCVSKVLIFIKDVQLYKILGTKIIYYYIIYEENTKKLQKGQEITKRARNLEKAESHKKEAHMK